MANQSSSEYNTEISENAKEPAASALAGEAPAGEPASGQDTASIIANLEKEKAELFDRLLRKQAEMENYRKRIEREKGDWYHQGVVDVIKEFLPVMDACERALASFQAVPDGANAVSNYRSGVELIYKQIQTVMKKFGVTPIEALGGSFDPNLHEALARIETEEHEENRVIEELQKGYMHRERLLRPAIVKVSAKPEKPSADTVTAQEETGL